MNIRKYRDLLPTLNDTLDSVGDSRKIICSRGIQFETTVEKRKGFLLGKVWSPQFFVERDMKKSNLPNEIPGVLTLFSPFLLIGRCFSQGIQHMLPLLEKLGKIPYPLLVVTEEINDELLATLIINYIRNALEVYVVHAAPDENTSNLYEINGLNPLQDFPEDYTDLLKLEEVQIRKHSTVALLEAGSEVYGHQEIAVIQVGGQDYEDQSARLKFVAEWLHEQDCYTEQGSLELQSLISSYREEITENQYIVGIDQNNNLCTSSWSTIPHRIIAGTTGSGKTNFLFSVIYQFLLANRCRQIYIVDFQSGLHFHQLARKFRNNIQLVTEYPECASLFEKVWHEHQERLNLMIENEVKSLEELEKRGIKKNRILLIIDEAASLLHAEGQSKKTIEKFLRELSAKSRVTGIHIIYCAQRPTPTVIPPIISDNMDERVVFRVGSTASLMLLGKSIASELPIEPKGKAIYRGADSSLEVVTTPYVADDVWSTLLQL